MALAAYRGLLRATRIAFEGDSKVLTAARDKVRKEFRLNLGLNNSDPSIKLAIEHANDVAAFLRTNLVQGKKQGDNIYKLRIHEHIERGDNDTIKITGRNVMIDSRTCAGM